MQLLVLGMHRSGTSSVTRLLNLAGAYFGPEDLEQLAEFITFADGPDEFIRAIEAALQADRRIPDRVAPLPHSWDVRIEEVLGLIDEAVERRRNGDR